MEREELLAWRQRWGVTDALLAALTGYSIWSVRAWLKASGGRRIPDDIRKLIRDGLKRMGSDLPPP